MTSQLTLPNPEWSPRDYQVPVLDYFQRGGTRAATVWHRRSGKDTNALHFTAQQMALKRGVYWHMLPEAVQARRAIWNNIVLNEVTGKRERQIDIVFPPAVRSAMNATEMRIELVNGSVWYLVGSDTYNSLVGTNPIGLVFSEYAVADPSAWDVLRPILAENGGWAWFTYTPRGRNHGWDLYESFRKSDKAFVEVLTIRDTTRPTGKAVITQEAVQSEIEEGMEPEMVEQEFYCSFSGVLMGAYFGSQLAAAEQAGRFMEVPHDPGHPVFTYWDLGVDDHTAIWFCQHIGFQARFICYFEIRDKGIDEVLLEITTLYPEYRYRVHYMPHDIEHRELTSGRSRRATLEDQQWGEIIPGAVVAKADSIHAGRRLFSQAWIDHTKCARGIECLQNYQKKWDPKLRTFLDTPLHNWASHGADAWMEAGNNIFGSSGAAPSAPTHAVDAEPLEDYDLTQPRYADDHQDPFNRTERYDVQAEQHYSEDEA